MDTEQPHGPRPDQEESVWDQTPGIVGHAGPYFPYDMEDPRAPKREKRAPGFVTVDDYVTRCGIVKEYARARRRRMQSPDKYTPSDD